MLNTISVELMKMRENKTFIFGALFTTGVVALVVVVNGREVNFPLVEWFLDVMIPSTMMISLMSGVMMTILMQQEYQNNTLINVLTAPVSRVSFIFSKLFAWLIWHTVTMILMSGVLFALTVWNFSNDAITEIAILLLQFVVINFLSFISLLPMLLVAVWQKKAFYPTTVLALILPQFQMMLGFWFSPILPWSATINVMFTDSMSEIIIGLISIFSVGIFSLVFACVSFAKQDQ